MSRWSQRMLTWLFVWLTTWCAGGATCYRQTRTPSMPPPPQVFQGLPTAEELAQVINRSDSIKQLSSNSVSVEVPSMRNVPRLSATLAVDRPRNFRMRASLPILLGSGIDLGSNQELFWFEVPESMNQTLYFARHEQYQRQASRSVLPVDPSWFVDALGLVHLDTAEIVEGPIVRTDGRLEVRTMRSMPDGLYSRVCVIEPTAGFITDQVLYGPSGKMIAAASGSNHRYYPDQQVALPHQVQIRLVPDGTPPLEMKLSIGNYTINQLLTSDPQLFQMPQTASQKVDLGAIGGEGHYVAPISSTPVVPPPMPRTAFAVPKTAPLGLQYR